MGRPKLKHGTARTVKSFFKASLEETNALRRRAAKEGKLFGAWAREELMRAAGVDNRTVHDDAEQNDVTEQNNSYQRQGQVDDHRCERCKRIGIGGCPNCGNVEAQR